MSRAAMQQALEALERAVPTGAITISDFHAAIAALRAALAEQDDDLTAAAAEERKRAEQAQPVADAARVIEWATSTPRKAAVHAFTEGPERQAAYWIEWAEARVVNRRLTTEQAQPLSGLDVERLLEDVVGSLPVARKLIRAVEAEVLRRMGVQQ